MYAAKGVGLAAPQVGVNKRLMVFNPGERALDLFWLGLFDERVCLGMESLLGSDTMAEEPDDVNQLLLRFSRPSPSR